MSYGPDFRDLFHDAAGIVDKILRGAKPADIRVRPEKRRELVVNLRTAKALGLKLPIALRGRAAAIH